MYLNFKLALKFFYSSTNKLFNTCDSNTHAFELWLILIGISNYTTIKYDFIFNSRSPLVNFLFQTRFRPRNYGDNKASSILRYIFKKTRRDMEILCARGEFSITEYCSTHSNVLCVLMEFQSEDCLVLGLRSNRNLFTGQHLAPIVLNSLFIITVKCATHRRLKTHHFRQSMDVWQKGQEEMGGRNRKKKIE